MFVKTLKLVPRESVEISVTIKNLKQLVIPITASTLDMALLLN